MVVTFAVELYGELFTIYFCCVCFSDVPKACTFDCYQICSNYSIQCMSSIVDEQNYLNTAESLFLVGCSKVGVS